MNDTNEMENLEALIEGNPEIGDMPVGSPEFNAAVAKAQKPKVAEKNHESDDDTTAGADDDQDEDSDEEDSDSKTEESNEHDEEDDSGKPRSLKRKLAKAQQREREAREELARLKGTAQKQPVAQLGDPKPQLDQYETYGEYNDALMDWKIEQRDLQKQSVEVRSKVETEWNAKEELIREEFPDYDKIVSPQKAERIGVMEPDVLAALSECESGPAVLNVLMRDPALVEKFSSASMTRKLVMIGQIEARLETGEPSEMKSASPKVLSTPPPKFPKGYAKTKMDPIADNVDMDFATWDQLMNQNARDKRRK